MAILSIANKLLSIRGKIEVTDELGNNAYEAQGQLAFFSPTWTLNSTLGPVATIRKRIFSWKPTWEIGGTLGAWRIRRKVLSWTRKYYLEGGPFDGTFINGSFLDLRFEIRARDGLIARASGKILTLRDRHNVEVLDPRPEAEVMTVIAMVVLQTDRADEAKRREREESRRRTGSIGISGR
jgi:uncharacterized protein YxjI